MDTITTTTPTTTEAPARKPGPDRTAYQADYYMRRKMELSERKARKYAEDPAYRAMIRRAADASKERLAAQRGPSGELSTARLLEVPTRPLAIDGVVVRVISGAALAVALGVECAALVRWERKGYLPVTPYRYGRARAYTEPQAAGVVAALRTFHDLHGPQVDARLAPLVAAQWRVCGIPVAPITPPAKKQKPAK
jgi:hypothetical protein